MKEEDREKKLNQIYQPFIVVVHKSSQWELG